MKYQAIVFDMDGVLIDSKTCMEKCWSEVVNKINTSVTFETYFSNIGKPFQEILAQIGIPENQRFLAEETYFVAQRHYSDLIHPYSGIERTLNELRHKAVLGLVTSKGSKATSHLLSKFAWTFANVVTPESCPRGKPFPDPLLYFAAHEQIDPRQCVYVGDMAVDQQAASDAGFHFIRADWGYQKFECEDVAFYPQQIIELCE